MYTGDVFGNVFFHRVPVSGVSALGEAEPVLLLGQELTTNETFKKSKLGQCESECPGQSKSQTDNHTIRNNAVVSMCSRSQDDGSILVAFKNGTIKQTGISRAKTSAFSGKVVLPFEPATECGGMQSLENGRYSVVLGQTSGIFGVIHDECWSGGTVPRIGQLSSEQGLATEVVLIGDARSTATSQREDSLFHVWAAGKGRTIRLIDEYSILWQATPHEPIHVTALAQVSNSPFLIAAATAKKKIVIYDIRKKGIQPDISVSTESLRGRPNKIRFFADCKCTVGDGLGELAVFDLRGKVTNHRNACLARLKAGNGAVVALDILHDAYAVAIFRDRYLRISKLSLPLHPITGNLVCERVQTVTPTALLTIPSLVQTDELCFLRRHVSSRELSVAQAGKRSNAETDPKGGNDRFSRAAHSISEKESNEMWSQLERVQGAFESTTSSLKNPELDNALTVSQRRRKKSVPSQGVTERKPQKRIR